MGNCIPSKKHFIFWPIAVLLAIATPVQAAEVIPEVEVAEEIKLYVQVKANQNQKPLENKDSTLVTNRTESHFSLQSDSPSITSKKYLIHCNLTFYD